MSSRLIRVGLFAWDYSRGTKLRGLCGQAQHKKQERPGRSAASSCTGTVLVWKRVSENQAGHGLAPRYQCNTLSRVEDGTA